MSGTPQIAALTVISNGADGNATGQGPRSSQISGLAVIQITDPADFTFSPQVTGLAVFQEGPMPAFGFGPFHSQAAGLAVFGDAVREQLNSRAWGFQLDGHSFYVLHLGGRGTFVYDSATKQWSNWITQGFPTWNMEHGWTWYSGRIVGAAEDGPSVFELDANVFTDEGFRNMIRTVTGLVSLRGRGSSIEVGALRITASVAGTETASPTITLRYSDDDGKTFEDPETIPLTAGESEQSYDFRSLGTIFPPGRIFEITDNGGVVTISDATLDIGDEDG